MNHVSNSHQQQANLPGIKWFPRCRIYQMISLCSIMYSWQHLRITKELSISWGTQNTSKHGCHLSNPFMRQALCSGYIHTTILDYHMATLWSRGYCHKFWFFFFFLVSICFLAALGFSCGMWDLSLQGTGFFLVVAHRLVCCGTCGILVPWPGIKHVSPALESRFLTTGPPGKSLSQAFLMKVIRLRKVR